MHLFFILSYRNNKNPESNFIMSFTRISINSQLCIRQPDPFYKGDYHFSQIHCDEEVAMMVMLAEVMIKKSLWFLLWHLLNLRIIIINNNLLSKFFIDIDVF